MGRKKTRYTRADIKRLDASDIKRLKRPAMRTLVRQAREIYDKQAKIFDKHSSRVYSHALEQVKEYYDQWGRKDINRLTLSDLRREIAHLQKFFQSQGATVSGATAIQKEQDIRIFGEDERGNPIKRLTLDQRRRYWSLYNEFMLYKNEAYSRIYSTIVQQQLGQMAIERKGIGNDESPFTREDFNELERRIDDARKQEWEKNDYDGTRERNILSGKRSD